MSWRKKVQLLVQVLLLALVHLRLVLLQKAIEKKKNLVTQGPDLVTQGPEELWDSSLASALAGLGMAARHSSGDSHGLGVSPDLTPNGCDPHQDHSLSLSFLLCEIREWKNNE